MDLKSLSSNWKKLQESLQKDNLSSASRTSAKRKTSSSFGLHEPINGTKKRRTEPLTRAKISNGRQQKQLSSKMSEPATAPRASTAEPIEHEGPTTAGSTRSGRQSSVSVNREDASANVNEGRSPTAEAGKYVAMDCEMVGVGPNPGNDSALARVTIVNYNGDQVYDSYVRPKEMVTDWRSHISGITPKHMAQARSLEQVQTDVAEIIDGRVLVGHAVRNDLEALLLSHPKRDIRDTSRHRPYRTIAGGGSPSLKILASQYLGLDIQAGAHSSLEDARATMMLYRRDKETFEREHAKKWPARVTVESQEKGEDQKKKKRKKKKKTRKR